MNGLTLLNCGGLCNCFGGARSGDVPVDGLRETGGDGEADSSIAEGAKTYQQNRAINTR